jgi:hypothetical protein
MARACSTLSASSTPNGHAHPPLFLYERKGLCMTYSLEQEPRHSFGIAKLGCRFPSCGMSICTRGHLTSSAPVKRRMNIDQIRRMVRSSNVSK